ncbi:MAG: Homeodomain-like protein [Benjaminiella poitrasii]|nr:MAG: Homeodomain-like protein [Benjaminiella poitrasii]
MLSPSLPVNNRRYSMGTYYDTLLSPPILTTTRSHSIKRNKRPATYSRWTTQEDELLRQAVQAYGPHKWALIASHVPNRTPMQCSTRWLGALNPNIHKGRWTETEDAVLRYSVLEYANRTDPQGRSQPIPWNKIAERIPNRTGIQCQARWTEALDPYVRKGKWGAEEDTLLIMGVKEFGRCWIRIAETIPGRTQRQCRTRWMQLKYKEDRQQHQKRNSIIAQQHQLEDASSQQSCSMTSDDDEDEDEEEDVKANSTKYFDFDAQLHQQQEAMMMLMLDDNNNTTTTSNTTADTMNQSLITTNATIDFLKEDDLFLDWSSHINNNFYL